MVKRLAILGIVLLFVFSFQSPAHCDDAFKKLGRGICNCVTFPLEIINRICKANNSEGPGAALTYGFAHGVVMTGFRAFIGFYEVATFPFPFPERYKPIITDPEFFFDKKVY